MSMTSKVSVPGYREKRGGLSPSKGSSLRGLFLAVLSSFLVASSFAQNTTMEVVDGVASTAPVDQITRLTSSSNVFTVNITNGTPVTGVGQYWFFFGTLFGAADVLETQKYSTVKDKTQYKHQFDDLPTNGGRLYVRLHWTDLTGGVSVIKWIDVVFLTANQHYIYSPAPGATIGAQDVDGCKAPPSVTFKWRTVQAIGYASGWLYVGTTPGGRDIANSGVLSAGLREWTVNNLPTNGNPVYVRLWWKTANNSAWFFADYVYQTQKIPTIVSPTPGGSMPGTTGSVAVNSFGDKVQFYWLYGGTAANPTEYMSNGIEVPAAERGTQVNLVPFQNLPDDGSTVILTLWWRLEGEGPDKWKCRQFTYTASTGPTITAPVSGGNTPDKLPVNLTGDGNQQVTWATNGTDVKIQKIELREAPDGAPVFATGNLAADVRMANIPNAKFTTDGRAYYIVLVYWVESGVGQELFKKEVVAAYQAKSVPYLTAPTSIAKCFTASLGNEVKLEWVDGGISPTPLGYWVYVGKTQGGAEYRNSGQLGAAVASLDINNLPTDGSTLWVRLWWLEEIKVTNTGTPAPGAGETVETTKRVWRARDFAFTNPSCPEITTPGYGGTIVGQQSVIQINLRGVAVDGLWVTVSPTAPSGGDAKNPNPGPASIDNTNLLAPTQLSPTIRNLPIDNSFVYVTLWWLVTNNQVSSWKYRTFRYVSSDDVPTPSLKTPNPAKPNEVNATNLTFVWNANNTVVFGWWLYVANTAANGGGADGRNVANSNFIAPGEIGADVSFAVTGLPNGTFYVTLWWLDAGLNWNKVQYTFSNQAGGGGGGGGGGVPFPDGGGTDNNGNDNGA